MRAVLTTSILIFYFSAVSPLIFYRLNNDNVNRMYPGNHLISRYSTFVGDKKYHSGSSSLLHGHHNSRYSFDSPFEVARIGANTAQYVPQSPGSKISEDTTSKIYNTLQSKNVESDKRKENSAKNVKSQKEETARNKEDDKKDTKHVQLNRNYTEKVVPTLLLPRKHEEGNNKFQRSSSQYFETKPRKIVFDNEKKAFKIHSRAPVARFNRRTRQHSGKFDLGHISDLNYNYYSVPKTRAYDQNFQNIQKGNQALYALLNDKARIVNKYNINTRFRKIPDSDRTSESFLDFYHHDSTLKKNVKVSKDGEGSYGLIYNFNPKDIVRVNFRFMKDARSPLTNVQSDAPRSQTDGGFLEGHFQKTKQPKELFPWKFHQKVKRFFTDRDHF